MITKVANHILSWHNYPYLTMQGGEGNKRDDKLSNTSVRRL